jgi:hypothetical protein
LSASDFGSSAADMGEAANDQYAIAAAANTSPRPQLIRSVLAIIVLISIAFAAEQSKRIGDDSSILPASR